jgi:hypothetical protein
MDFVRGKETLSEPVDSLPNLNKRSISPEIKRVNDNHVHNSEDHQNKRKKILIKRALLKSFISSVNTKINLKRPSLPITIPTHLFLDQSLSDSMKQEGMYQATTKNNSIFVNFLIDERSQRTSKRYANGSLKHDINKDVIDSLSQLSSSSLNNQTITIHGTHQKKNKTSHGQDKLVYKHEPSTTVVKNEQITISNPTSANETDSKTRTTLLPTTNTATVIPIITAQPKKEKPTAK